MTYLYDAAVIGAGIAGSVMAESLADHGWDTVLFDRKAFPRHKVCGEFLSPESLTMLRRLGLRDAVLRLEAQFNSSDKLDSQSGKATGD